MLHMAALAAGLAVLAAPGFFLWTAIFPEDDLIDRLTWGASAGLALAVLLAFYASLFRLSLFWPAWAAVAAVSVALLWRCRPRNTRPQDANWVWLVCLLAIVALSRFAPTLLRQTPPGWDPSFHLLLARKLELANHLIRDWSPFETVALNYPLGSHLLLVILSRLTLLPLHRVFQLLIPALGVLTTAQVYGLARRVFRSSEVALYSALAYGMWAFLGSIAYYNWGGLPNQLGMIFLIPVIAILAGERCDLRRAGAIAVFLAATFVTHHHVALVAGLALGVATVYLLLASESTEPAKWSKLRALMLGVGGGIVLAAAHLVPEAMKAATIGDTDALRFDSPKSILLLMAGMGVMFLAMASCGVVLSCQRTVRTRCSMVLAISAALVVAYILCGPAYRAYALQRWGEERVALAPSRFVTDLVYFLSLFAGYAMYRVGQRTGLQLRTGLAIGLLLSAANFPMWRETFAPDREADRFAAYAWIQEHTPADTVVLTGDAWAPYASWRRTLVTPLPASEPRVYDNDARRAAAAMAAGHAPAVGAVVAVIAPGGKWQRGTVLWRSSSGWLVLQQWPESKAKAKAGPLPSGAFADPRSP
jgi:hypothetical protein